MFSFPTIGGDHVVAAPVTRVVGYRRRLRWENIVPMSALVACIVTALLVFAQFDEIRNGQSNGANSRKDASARATTGAVDAASATTSGEMTDREIDALVKRAEQALARGDFESAKSVTHPLMEHAAEDARIDELHARIDRAAARHARLSRELTQLARAERWQLALAKAQEVKRVAPLTRQQRMLQERARVALVRMAKAKQRAASAARRAGSRSAARGGGSRTTAASPSKSKFARGGSSTAPPTSPPRVTRPPDAPRLPNPGAASGGGSVAGPQPGVVTAG